jgi:CheY-like chemotaxis protein
MLFLDNVPAVDACIRLLLKLPDLPAIRIKARVVRQEKLPTGETSVALVFVHTPMWAEDMIHQAVVSSLECRATEEGPLVLVVDDCPAIRKALARQLGALQHQVLLAATPLDAMHTLEEACASPAAALVDLFLGADDGLEILTYLAEEYPEARRILMSGQIRPAQLELALASGRAHAVLHKPWDQVQLCEALAT